MASPQTQSSLDKIPAELRINIFGLALHHKDALLLVHPDGRVGTQRNGEDEPKANIALLIALVNDPKYAEALDAFYTVNSFRLTRSIDKPTVGIDLKDVTQGPLAYIKHLQLTDVASFLSFLGFGNLMSTLDFCLRMPKLKSLTIAYDSLHREASVRKWLRKVRGLAAYKLICVGIGHFQLQSPDNITIDFQHYGLMRSWQAMKRTSPSVFADMIAEIRDAINNAPKEEGYGSIDYRYIGVVIRYLGRVRLAEWVTLFDEHTRMHQDARRSHVDSEETAARLFEISERDLSTIEQTTNGKIVMARTAAGVNFRDLDEANNCSDMLESVSDLLGRATLNFPNLLRGDEQYQRMEVAHLNSADSAGMPYGCLRLLVECCTKVPDEEDGLDAT
ncbi:hypothetical protein LTR17_013504 [Elasticomyces elasticus]|nr:hypothetical protein LTR17_013504 [Elasticomyces elasticus]